ncbi:MAG: F0F1 ATP synthase subunit delta [Candidatus Omnitrophica bacterium]|nr:F0F1 ATP synthase subunit delta [Candidatus Omnitrophota bacterium]
MLTQLLIIQAVTFVGLILVLRVVFYRQLKTALDRLKRLHEENLAREEQLKKEIEAGRQEREAELAKARDKAADIVKDAKDKSEKIGLDIEAQAKDQAQKILEKAKLEVNKMRDDLFSQYEQEALELSIQMLKAAFTKQGNEVLQHHLISELLEEIKNLESDRFIVKTKQAKVTSAFALSPEEKADLAHTLSQKLLLEVELEEIINPEIIAGLVINAGPLTIDGSLRNKLAKIVPYLGLTKEK